MKINYIPVFYFGIKRNNNPKDKFFFLKKHLEFISNLTLDSNIEASFVINKTEFEDIQKIESVVSDYLIKIPFEIIYRKNVNSSYGGWNDAIKKNINKDYDYSFLIEDDYLPTSNDFYKPFLQEMSPNVAYVCTKVFNGQKRGFPRHAAISNGLISNEKCKIVLQQNNKVFYLSSSSTNNYHSAEYSQVLFLSLLTAYGFTFEQISDDFSKPFLDSNEKGVINYGGDLDAPIIPLVVPQKELL